jgi:hypothetical protein
MTPADGSARWTQEQAEAWRARVGWLIGCNYTPAYACNQIEMWAETTFDAGAIERELADAAGLGFNALRVYLHDLAFAADPAGFLERMDQFLGLAQRHRIGIIPVLFDSVWHPLPQPGPQHEPTPGVHNAGWVQSPGVAVLGEPARFRRLEPYVAGVVGHFRNDPRILLWDIWNEPDNANEAACGPRDLGAAKSEVVRPLLDLAFTWTRAAGPTQPLTSGLWAGDWDTASLTPLRRRQLDSSDIITFHCYGDAAAMAARIAVLRPLGRPIVCTEYMARPHGSTFEAILPLLAREGIGAISWGLHRGRTQTHLAWDTWAAPCAGEPDIWFHDILWPDGRPYRDDEARLIRRIAATHAGRIPG